MWESIEDRIMSMPGIIQSYTDTVAKCFENGYLNKSEVKNKQLLEEAISKQEYAIMKREYPKFLLHWEDCTQ